MATAKHGNGTKDRKRDALSWLLLAKQRTNDVFFRLLFVRLRFLVLMGGGGSGKSIFAGQKIIERCVREPGHRVLVCRKVAKTLRHSCFDQLVRQVQEMYPDEVLKIPRGQSGDMYIKFRCGSEIIFAGLDDAEKLKSIVGVTMIWMEEATEFEEGDLNQLDIRLRDKSDWYQQIIITFNPVSITHWLKRRFFDNRDPDACVLKTTYKDNRFLQESAIRTLEKFKKTDPYYYDVYALGNWGVLGKTVFHKLNLARRREEHRPAVFRGTVGFEYDGMSVRNWRLIESRDEDCDLILYELPQAGHPYVIGGDTAGEGSDWFVGQIIDNSTGEQIGKFRIQTDEDLYARAMYSLGMIYNEALLAIEGNYSSHPNKELERLGYRKLFLRQVEDSLTRKYSMSIGVRTDKLTRPVMISLLVEIARDYPELINDEETIDEMLTFVRNERGRAEAEAGSHDDCVMALAIAHYAREQQSMVVTKPAGKRVKWRQDQWEDYWNAKNAGEREYLKKLWGEPE